jgi:hypothetical protein
MALNNKNAGNRRENGDKKDPNLSASETGSEVVKFCVRLRGREAMKLFVGGAVGFAGPGGIVQSMQTGSR